MLNKPALKKMIEGTRDERAYLAEHSFQLFFVYYYIDNIKYPFAPFHYEIMDNFEKLVNESTREFLMVAFRESAKSTIARAYVTWLTIFKKRKYILLVSQDLQNAESSLFDVVNTLQTNGRIIADYGNLCPDSKQDKKGFNRIKKFLTAHDVLLETLTTQQSPRGRLSKTRPDFALLDDIENLKTVSSDLTTEKTRLFLRELRTAMDSDTGRMLYLGNYISDLGIIHELIQRQEKMLYLNVPIHNTAGELAWPQKYTLTDEKDKVTLQSVKDIAGDSITFENEYLNMPMSEERRVFKRAFFKHIDGKPVDKMLSCFILVDPAFTTKKASDYTGISIVWIDKEGFWYVKAWREKVTPKELVDLIFVLYENHKPEKVGIEEMSFTHGLKPYMDEEMRKRGKHLPIVMLKHGGTHKETRIQGLLSYYEAGTILHIKGECDALEEELIRFPLSNYDDVSDSLAYAPQVVYKPHDSSEFDKIMQQEEPLFPDIGV